jgi:hypothetical protein
VTVQHVLPVTLTGSFLTDQANPIVHYQVFDQYGLYQPSGTVKPLEVGVLTKLPDGSVVLLPPGPLATQLGGTPQFAFSAQIGLSIVRKPFGRQYFVLATASDPAGGSAQAVAPVAVPPVGYFNFVVQVRKSYKQ